MVKLKQRAVAMRLMMVEPSRKYIWILFEVLIAALFVFSVLIDFKNLPLVIGVMFLSSPILREKMYMSEISDWICQFVFKPKWKYNSILWGTISILFWFLQIFAKKKEQVEQKYFDYNEILWISIVVIIVNLLVGFYSYKSISESEKRSHY